MRKKTKPLEKIVYESKNKMNFIVLFGIGGFQESFVFDSLFICLCTKVGLISHRMLELEGSFEIIVFSPFD